MTIIAAAVIGKSGKALVSRQFGTETPSRTRMEGFLETFSKLVGSDKSQRQHTYIDAESIRYVYQPMDNIYMVLITTRHSNIIEDLETLRLFSRVIPEYCRSNEEKEILDKAFELIFAFDEIVALGRRENVNLAQIRTFTEMDSHEERVFNQIQQAQARAAQENAKEKEKQFKKERAEMAKKMRPGGGIASATAISSSTPMASAISDMSDMKISAPKPSARGALLMARFFFAAVLVGLVVLQIHADFAADLKPIMQVVKPSCVAIKKGCKAAATNVKAAVQNVGAAAQQCGNGVAKVAGAATVGVGKTVADAPERANQLIKQLEKKGPIATVSKILFGPPPKNTSVKGGKKEGKEGDKSVLSEEN